MRSVIQATAVIHINSQDGRSSNVINTPFPMSMVGVPLIDMETKEDKVVRVSENDYFSFDFHGYAVKVVKLSEGW